MKYKKHVFICTNDKEGGKKCCGSENGMKLVMGLKDAVKELGIPPLEMRIQRSGCLDVCSKGPAMVVYPEGVFYGNVTENDLKEIAESHLKNDKIVDRLKLDFE